MTAYRTPAERAAPHPSGWARLRPGVSVTRLPLVDLDTGLFARLTYRDAEMVADRHGGRLPTREDVLELVRVGHLITPSTLSYGPEMVTREHAQEHDRLVREKLLSSRWDGVRPVMNVGKWWRHGATGENVAICGWWDGSKLIQSGIARDNPHHLGAARSHVDYGTLTIVVVEGDTDPPETERPMAPRHTIRLGSTGPDVARWQTIIGATADGQFGPRTREATIAWQEHHRLVADGVVGPRSWAAAGEPFADPPPSSGIGPAPACLAALRDATARWPGRSSVSDGIMGDARHLAAGTSSHNAGNAVDITHDPSHGVDAGELARLALTDPRCVYVIFGRRIWNKRLGDDINGQGRPYGGSNPHTHHCHIDIDPTRRGDDSPWPWFRP